MKVLLSSVATTTTIKTDCNFAVFSKCQVWLWKLESNDRGMWYIGLVVCFFLVSSLYVRTKTKASAGGAISFIAKLFSKRTGTRREMNTGTQLRCRVCMSFLVSG